MAGKCPTRCFENTIRPSATTSNWLFSPAMSPGVEPLRCNTAARLAARSSYPDQTGQKKISTVT